MRRTQIYIDEALDRQLRATAAAQGRSAAALIRQALRAYLSTDIPGSHVDDADVDPILAMIGALSGLPEDAAAEHDRDLYGTPTGSASDPATHRSR